jgi:hypothetical protein
MLTSEHAAEILQALKVLPPDKVAEVRDFVLFLKERYGAGGEDAYAGHWSEEDLRDLTRAVWDYAEQTVPWDEPAGGPES